MISWKTKFAGENPAAGLLKQVRIMACTLNSRPWHFRRTFWSIIKTLVVVHTLTHYTNPVYSDGALLVADSLLEFFLFLITSVSTPQYIGLLTFGSHETPKYKTFISSGLSVTVQYHVILSGDGILYTVPNCLVFREVGNPMVKSLPLYTNDGATIWIAFVRCGRDVLSLWPSTEVYFFWMTMGWGADSLAAIVSHRRRCCCCGATVSSLIVWP